jgi:hypothetical protein
MVKMSEVLWNFVEPYLNLAPTEKDLYKLLGVASLAWNAALLSPAERARFLETTGATLGLEAAAEFRAVMDELIQRKLDHFADIQRGIYDFTLTMNSNGPYLQVMSTMPAP